MRHGGGLDTDERAHPAPQRIAGVTRLATVGFTLRREPTLTPPGSTLSAGYFIIKKLYSTSGRRGTFKTPCEQDKVIAGFRKRPSRRKVDQHQCT